MATAGPLRDGTPEIAHLPALYDWYKTSVVEAKNGERYCLSCFPGHAPSLRLPDIRMVLTDERLVEKGYLKLKTDPFKVSVLFASENEGSNTLISEGPIVGARTDIWIPRKENPRQHWIFNLRKDPEDLSDSNRKHLKAKIDEFSKTQINDYEFPKAIVSGKFAFFLMIIDHPVERWASGTWGYSYDQ